MQILLKISLNSDIGCTRTNNEDMILISGEKYRDCSDEFQSFVEDKGRFIAAVADGMGGHNAGEVASEMALDLIDNFSVRIPQNLCDNDFRNLLDNEIVKIHDQIISSGRINTQCLDMGTTLVAWLTYENRIYLVNIGDSRGYRLRKGILCQLTKDHSEQNRLNDHTIPSNLIYNCLGGGGGTVFADVKEITNKVFEGDVFLLCSDGVSNYLNDEEIEKELIRHCHATTLIDAVKKKGGPDNISAIVISIKKMII